MLLEGDAGLFLLPSMTELILVDAVASECDLWSLCDALMKRVEQGIPLEVLGLRMSFRSRHCSKYQAQLRRLSEIVVYVLGLESYEVTNA